MADGSKIEWLARPGTKPASWNPIRARNRETGRVGWYCAHKSPGCELCYAEAMNARLGTGVAFKAQNQDQVEIFVDERTLLQPLRWRQPRTVFVCSMTDLAGEFVSNSMLHRVFAVMALAERHTFIVLTKRSNRLRLWLEQWKGRRFVAAIVDDDRNKVVDFPLRNVWLGVSVEDQRRADERIPDLLATPAAVRFISAEPLLTPIDIGGASSAWRDYLRPYERDNSEPIDPPLDWIIIGGESGPGARPFRLEWARDIVAACAAADVACFVKQIGANARLTERAHEMPYRTTDAKGGDPAEWPDYLRVRQWPETRA